MVTIYVLQALYHSMDKYLQGLFVLANDPVAEVRKLVCVLFKLLSIVSHYLFTNIFVSMDYRELFWLQRVFFFR